jgi:chemotaxis protein methyltransferase CheR
MTEQEYAFVAKLLRDRCALVLDPGKEYLLETRLGPVARKHGIASVTELIGKLRLDAIDGLSTEVVEAMVTTETSFFRDVHPFETLRKTVLPELIQARQAERRLNIWCAASSSGQEPYTLALILKEYCRDLTGWAVNLLATDISQDMLRRSKEGRYSQLEVNRGLPVELLLKYFRQEGVHWQLRDDVRSMVSFRQVNLAQPFPLLPPMDLIMLRNVMIYFDTATKKTILRQIARVLRPDGYLVLGGAETTFGLDDGYRRVETLKGGFYRLADS